MTTRLYDTDSHLREFTAAVLRCEPAGARWRVVLDRTAFFPEGGGQPADTGALNGAAVTDVQEESGEVAHYTDAPLEPGTTAHGVIDWGKRFRRMQAHTGEHIVSGLVHTHYGYRNVGFHLGDETVTMDYDGELTWEQLMEIERLANEAVWRDVPVRIEYPAPEALVKMTYRSKLDLRENVRIVTVEGYDVCACCAPHVSRTGEVGAIKIVDSMRHRGGVRLTILCGADAQADYALRHAQVASLSHLLSVPRADVVAAAERLLREKEALERELEEELGVRIGTRWLLETIEHDYERFHLVMDCFVCHLTGDDEPQSLEHRELRWLGLPDLLSVDWLPADRKVVMLLGTYWSQAFEAEHL